MAAVSFIYFRVFVYIQSDRDQYRKLIKIGLKRSEIKKIVTQQLILLFFLPFVVASSHALVILSTWNQIEIKATQLTQSLQVISIFLMIQSIYFLWIRSKYIRSIFHV
ncbi:hypothetical protein J2Z48_000985 [Croceifilum oryzae]|uniref:ABC3 transporter permease protein domain-containing protein n=1 Tax=Croceifilum oryzae TaxID=1553429 RepID=A0AAJ1WRY7_9BACL|nr:hypothetical protein [Croceifilum oryzae]MDQ0416813.1 hypothetical protein [Croceifilum oryzae]